MCHALKGTLSDRSSHGDELHQWDTSVTSEHSSLFVSLAPLGSNDSLYFFLSVPPYLVLLLLPFFITAALHALLLFSREILSKNNTL